MTQNAKIPLPKKPEEPSQFSIGGITDTIANLKTFVGSQDFDDGLKTYVCAMLDKMKSNAAEIHLHEIERTDGGFNLHLTIAAVHLGAKPVAAAPPKVDLPTTSK